MKFFVKTFGCQQNKADSERIASAFKARGMTLAKNYDDANYVVVNTCMIRHNAEERVYGLVQNLSKLKKKKMESNKTFKIVVTGCMVGLAFRDKTGKFLQSIRSRMPTVDEFMPIEEVGFDNQPIRQDGLNAWVPISNGCNNFCTFCVVPFTRGREISRPFEDIIKECKNLKLKGYRAVTLLGQNVNSYGADLLLGEKNIQVMRDLDKKYFKVKKAKMPVLNDLSGAHPDLIGGARSPELRNTVSSFLTNKKTKPVYVKHLGRYRIPTLFPHLLEHVAKMRFEKVDFMSSNPWDFSDELIDVIARNKNITRLVHLPIQHGDNGVLRRMNRWYTTEEYLNRIDTLRKKIPDIKFSTDIIVGFCGETEEEFKNTVRLVKLVHFEKAYISMYSERPMTAATKVLRDDVSPQIKRRRWIVLENLINQPHFISKTHTKGKWSETSTLGQ